MRALQKVLLSQVQSFLLQRAIQRSQLKHHSLLLLYLHTHTHAERRRASNWRLLVSGERCSTGFVFQHRVHPIVKQQSVLTSASFSFSVLCSSDNLSLSRSLSARSLSVSSSEAFSCVSLWESRPSRTLFCWSQ